MSCSVELSKKKSFITSGPGCGIFIEQDQADFFHQNRT